MPARYRLMVAHNDQYLTQVLQARADFKSEKVSLENKVLGRHRAVVNISNNDHRATDVLRQCMANSSCTVWTHRQ